MISPAENEEQQMQAETSEHVLTDRERACLRLAIDNVDSYEIARRLRLSPETVSICLASAAAKLASPQSGGVTPEAQPDGVPTNQDAPQTIRSSVQSAIATEDDEQKKSAIQFSARNLKSNAGIYRVLAAEITRGPVYLDVRKTILKTHGIFKWQSRNALNRFERQRDSDVDAVSDLKRQVKGVLLSTEKWCNALISFLEELYNYGEIPEGEFYIAKRDIGALEIKLESYYDDLLEDLAGYYISKKPTDDDVAHWSRDQKLDYLDAFVAAFPGKSVANEVTRMFPAELETSSTVAVTANGPAIPSAAPRLWSERDKSREADPFAFTMEVYRPWLGRGLERGDVLHLDPGLYRALREKKDQAPPDFNLPTRKQRNDRWVERVAQGDTSGLTLDAVRRLGPAVARRKSSLS